MPVPTKEKPIVLEKCPGISLLKEFKSKERENTEAEKEFQNFTSEAMNDCEYW